MFRAWCDACGQPCLAVFGDKDPRFARTRGAPDARMKKLTKEGVGTETMQAQPLTPEQEEKLVPTHFFVVYWLGPHHAIERLQLHHKTT